MATIEGDCQNCYIGSLEGKDPLCHDTGCDDCASCTIADLRAKSYRDKIMEGIIGARTQQKIADYKAEKCPHNTCDHA